MCYYHSADLQESSPSKHSDYLYMVSPILSSLMKHYLSKSIQDFDYFLRESIPPIECKIEYIFDKINQLYFCQFEVLQRFYKCPYSAKTKTKAKELACLHYLYTKEIKCFPSNPIIPFESYFEMYSENPMICSFDFYKADIIFKDPKNSDVEALTRLLNELRDADYENVRYTNDLVQGTVTITNRFGTKTVSPELDISSMTNEEKKRVLARTTAKYLLSVRSRLH
eukprot:NODE_488_length_7780_cov_0.211691.p3 type:complete len:225 gc:universal NODE_488_length_7780_cov_0.211691:6613-5939(-)